MKRRITSICYSICYLILFCFSLVTADAQNSCCNMLTNGDFELGDTGFTSDLPQDCNCIADSYCVGTNFQDKCGGWQNFNGHGGSGQFLIIDGSTGGPVDVWQNSVLISDEGEYCFSFWAASQYASAFDLGFMIDGALVGGPFTVSQSPPNWTEYSGTVYLTPGTYNIAIRQLTGGGERDFGIDDISFGASVNAGFIVDLSINCGAHLQFLNTSSGPPFLTYTWDFGDPASGLDNFSNQQNPNHLYTSCGEFEVCLIVTNGECTDIACQIVIVDEVVPPIIMCPPFIVLDCDDDLSPGTTGFATATDNCDFNPNIQYSDALFGNIPCGGEIIRTWTATDFCGNVSTCDQNIIVFDDVPPVITCPQNVIVNALPPECMVEVNGIQWLTNTDNCGIPTVDYLITGAGAIPSFGIKDASGADFNAGVSTVMYISSDQCGNKDTCMFTVTVNCIMQGSCVCAASGNPKPNLVVNGDFELGDNFFNSDLNTGPPCASGNYSVGNDFPVQCNLWPAGIFDHTFMNNTGNFMIVDGNPSIAPTVWSQSVNVVPGKTYEFCFWTASVHCQNQQDFTLDVIMHGLDGNNDPAFDTMGQEIIVEPCPPSGQPFTPTWIQHQFTWTCPPTLLGPYNLEINQVSGTFGDQFTDFGLDDICFTEVTTPSDSCCNDFLTFESAITLTIDNDSCKATLNISDLPCDDYIEWIDWGHGPVDFGPFTGGSMPMHTYPGSGNYYISYLAIEIDPATGLFCHEKIFLDTITCSNCFCKTPGFTNLILHSDPSSGQSIECETSYDDIPCPKQGFGYFFTGKFECEGDSCEMIQNVSWNLSGPTGTHSGTVQASPYFVVNLLPSHTNQNGIYTMSVSSICGTDTCKCEFQFAVDCDTLCPCDPDVIKTLSAAVNQGFAVSSGNTSCQVCFTPIALSDCETVDWHLNNSSGQLLGSSTGNHTFCYTFLNPGTYTIAMVVTRLKPDGTPCESFVKIQTINVTCAFNPVCIDPVIKNYTFSDGAIPGGMSSGGSSEGWTSIVKELEVIEGQAGSQDNWTIKLHGNLDTAGVLTNINPICLARDTGVITLRVMTDPIPGIPGSLDPPVGRGKPRQLAIQVYQGNTLEVRKCADSTCMQLAMITMEEFVPGEWYDITIPYDFRDWHPNDSCGAGILIRPAIYVTNDINTVQGGEETYSYAQIDHFCIDGTLVSTDIPRFLDRYRLFPNPNSGSFTLELPQPATPEMSIRIIGLTGQIQWDQRIEVGTKLQTIHSSALPSGMYFLQVWREGRIVAVEKFVRM